METEATFAKIASPARDEAQKKSRIGLLASFWALTKPDVNFLIAITVFVGFCLARPATLETFPYALLINTLIGSLLVASGTGALNQVIERQFDSQMRRTSRRPLVNGRISPVRALQFGILVSLAGVAYLALAVNALSSLISGLTLVSYLAIYTPLKRKTPLCTFVGALPGAAPPLIGWAAASGNLSFESWLLYSMLFLWQFPHFMAIAWMYREDYAHPLHRRAILSGQAAHTGLTRGFTGRLARGIRNQLLTKLDGPGADFLPYPLQRSLMKNLALPAQEAGRADLLALWAGQSANLARDSDLESFLRSLVQEMTAPESFSDRRV
jgi:hypothetical protein